MSHLVRMMDDEQMMYVKVKLIFGILLTFDVVSGLPSCHLLSICLVMLLKKRKIYL